MRVTFTAALLLGLVLRVATLPLPGTEDVGPWKIWSYAASHDLTAMYGVGGSPPVRGIVSWGDQETTVNYPPFALYEFAFVGHVYKRLFPQYPDTLALLIALKLPVLFADMGLTWLLFAAVRGVSGGPDAARWAALAFWLNPATFFGGEMLAYVEPLFMLPATAGLVLACAGRPLWAGTLVAVAAATKPQAILVGPSLALALWQAGGLVAIATGGLAFSGTLALVVVPFLVRGALPNMWLAFGSFYGRRDTLSAFAANIGWIVNWFLRGWLGLAEFGFPQAFLKLVPRPLAISRFVELGFPNPRPFATGAVLATTAWAAWVGRRALPAGRLARLSATPDLHHGLLSVSAALGAFTVHSYFVLSVGAHENHQLFEVPLLALAAALRPRLRPLFMAVSTAVALNINIYYGIGRGWGWAVPRMLTVLDLGVVLSFVNVGLLVWFARAFAREARASSTPNAAGYAFGA